MAEVKTVISETSRDKLALSREDDSGNFLIEVPQALEHLADTLQMLPAPLSDVVDNILLQNFSAGAEFKESSPGTFDQVDTSDAEQVAVEQITDIVLDYSLARIQAEHMAVSVARILTGSKQ